MGGGIAMKNVDRVLRNRRANPEGAMSMVDHLRELRRRLLSALGVLAAGSVAGWFLYGPVMHLLQQPYCSVSPEYRFGGQDGGRCVLVFTGVLDGFTTHLKLAVLVGAVLTAPVWLYQIWAFVTPGLKRVERMFTLAFVASSSLLFAGGAALAYEILGRGMSILLRAGGGDVQAMLTVNSYLSFVILTLVVFGLSFELPLLIVMANLAGVLSSDVLKRTQRVAIFTIVVFAGIVVPSPDPFSMCALILPMAVLYELSVGITILHDRKAGRRAAQARWADETEDLQTEPLERVPA
jgi:sec-independent protein translocase protein TatC